MTATGCCATAASSNAQATPSRCSSRDPRLEIRPLVYESVAGDDDRHQVVTEPVWDLLDRPVEHDDVRTLPGLERPDLVRQAQEPGGVQRAREQRLAHCPP